MASGLGGENAENAREASGWNGWMARRSFVLRPHGGIALLVLHRFSPNPAPGAEQLLDRRPGAARQQRALQKRARLSWWTHRTRHKTVLGSVSKSRASTIPLMHEMQRCRYTQRLGCPEDHTVQGGAANSKPGPPHFTDRARLWPSVTSTSILGLYIWVFTYAAFEDWRIYSGIETLWPVPFFCCSSTHRLLITLRNEELVKGCVVWICPLLHPVYFATTTRMMKLTHILSVMMGSATEHRVCAYEPTEIVKFSNKYLTYIEVH